MEFLFKHFLLFIICLLPIKDVFSQDTLLPFIRNIHISQTFTYMPHTEYEPYWHTPYREAHSHTRITLNFNRNFSAGIQNILIHTSGTYPSQLFHLFGPLVQAGLPIHDDSFFYSELGYLRGDFLLGFDYRNELTAIRKQVDYLNYGFGAYRMLKNNFFLDGGIGITHLLQMDERAMQRFLFFYRFGIGYRINLKNTKSGEYKNIRKL